MNSGVLERLLLARGLVREEGLERAREAVDPGEDIYSSLIRLRILSEESALHLVAEELGHRFLSVVPDANLDRSLVEGMPLRHLKQVGALPMRMSDGGVRLALCHPLRVNVLREFAFLLRRPELEPVFVPRQSVLAALDTVYGAAAEAQESLGADFGDDAGGDLDENSINDLLEETSDAPFIRLVNRILAQAVKAGASDVHIEPFKSSLRVRFRLDGVLYDRYEFPIRLHSPVVSRIKIMAQLNIAEKRLPQDGRIELKLGDRQVDLRVSSLPTAYGERLVLRLLEKNSRVLSLEELGLHRGDLPLLRHLADLPHGIVLVTGPTGSGKTTTLYSLLNQINAPDKNILTIEDPIEYQLDGVGQMQVNPKIDLTFARGLRSIVRQDPDVILIGEIRDGETAEIAIQAALTGHLVFATLHTNDAPGAITRLIDMGTEPFLVSSTVRAIVAQRLVRLLCPHCKARHVPDDAQLRELGITREQAEQGNVCHPVGCERCMNTGYRSRAAIFEVMVMSEALQALVLETQDANEIRRKAMEEGMLTLQADGRRKVLEGATSIAEILRVTSL